MCGHARHLGKRYKLTPSRHVPRRASRTLILCELILQMCKIIFICKLICKLHASPAAAQGFQNATR